MATVEGLPLNLSHEEIKNMWYVKYKLNIHRLE